LIKYFFSWVTIAGLNPNACYKGIEHHRNPLACKTNDLDNELQRRTCNEAGRDDWYDRPAFVWLISTCYLSYSGRSN